MVYGGSNWFPFTKVPVWIHVFEPQPDVCKVPVAQWVASFFSSISFWVRVPIPLNSSNQKRVPCLFPWPLGI